jgi:hypothetical protein
MITAPIPGQILRTFGGPVDVRIEIDTGLAGSTFGLWDVGTWGESTWGSENPDWNDITHYVLGVMIDQGADRWGERFRAGTASIRLDNSTGVFTPDSGVPSPWHLPFRPGRRLRVVAYPDPDDPLTAEYLFFGEIDASFDAFSDAAFDVEVTLPCTDFTAQWSDHNPPALETPTGVEDTHDRVDAALDRMDWPVELRDIQEGEHSMQSSFLAQSTLEECQTAADAEGGAFFCSKDGKATFKARDWLIVDTRPTEIQGYLGYEEVPEGANAANVVDIQTSWEIARVINQVRFARIGSTMQSVNDPASQALYDIRSYPRTDFQNNTDAEVLALAERYLTVFKDSRIRLDAVTITPNADPDNEDLNRLFWDSQLGDLLSVRVQTGQGWGYDRLVNLMGLHHEITPDDWTVTFRLDDAQINFLSGRELLVLRLSPVAWWQFRETSGTTTDDESGNSHTLSWSGGAALVGTGGPNGTGLVTLDGSNDFATVDNETGLELFADMSIEAWFRPHDDGGTEDAIITARGTTPLYELYYYPPDQDVSFYPANSAGSIAFPNGVTPADEWSHLVVTVQWTPTTRTIRFYINGQPDSTRGPYTYLPAAESRAVNVGRRATNADLYFDGDLAELVVYDRVLSDADVLNLYNSTYE